MLREWRRSRLSVREFCDFRGLSEPSFYSWRREIAKRDREAVRPESGAYSSRPQPSQTAAGVPGPAFLPVRVVADELAPHLRGAHHLDVRLPTGVQLRVPSGFDRQTLVDVLAALEKRPC
jgi:hypothetical protein